MDEVGSTLNNSEIKVLKVVYEKDGLTPEQIFNSGEFEKIQEVMNSVSWLSSKGLIRVDEKAVIEVRPGSEAIRYANADLPEKAVLKYIVSNGESSLEELLENKIISQGNKGPAMGWLKKKNLATINKVDGKIVVTPTEHGKDMANKIWDEEVLLKKILQGSYTLEDGDMETYNLIKSRKEFVTEKVRHVRNIYITEMGRKLNPPELKTKEETSRLLPEHFINEKWRDIIMRPYDINAFSPRPYVARKHPLAEIINRIKTIFIEMGFTEISGNYIENAFWNMDALFIPQDHPAREMQDTIYLNAEIPPEDNIKNIVKNIHENGGESGSSGWQYKWDSFESAKALLRTHTTVNTIRYLYNNRYPPVKVFSVGKVFRKEAIDSTHLPEFHQIEGIVMEKDASLAMLIGILKEFYIKMGFREVRVRPAYFPYTEPSMEVEIRFGEKWMELGGAGIFRPEVTTATGVKYPVLAWGLGLERLAMLVLGLKDIRELYMSDLKWLEKREAIW